MICFISMAIAINSIIKIITKIEYINPTHAHVDCFKILFDKRKTDNHDSEFCSEEKKTGKSETER